MIISRIKILFLIIFFLFFNLKNLLAINIATIKIDLILNNSVVYVDLIKNLELIKKKSENQFNNKEKILLI